MFLAIDPGADQGWALIHDNGILYSCGLSEAPNDFPSNVIAGAVCILEHPVIYPDGEAKPSTIITLALRAGRAEGWAQSKGWTTEWVEPRTWKGMVPKRIHHNRIKAKLSPEELEIFQWVAEKVGAKAHNVLDAIALGKWRARCIFPPP